MNLSAMSGLSGTYALVLRSRRSVDARIGRRGRLDVRRGYYVYVGSAFGPGGVRARVSRHCRARKSKRWHIDYLRVFVRPVAVWCSCEPVRLEHRWANALGERAELTPVAGFGCSDCRCAAHLFFAQTLPELDACAGALEGAAEFYSLEKPR